MLLSQVKFGRGAQVGIFNYNQHSNHNKCNQEIKHPWNGKATHIYYNQQIHMPLSAPEFLYIR
jgi:hypothetical protein